MLKKLNKHADLMSKMTEKVGLELGDELLSGKLSAIEIRDAVVTCTHCKNVSDCQKFLDDANANVEHAPEYCLNKQMISKLRRNKN